MPVVTCNVAHRAIKTLPHLPRFQYRRYRCREIAQLWMGVHLLNKAQGDRFTALPEYPEILDLPLTIGIRFSD